MLRIEANRIVLRDYTSDAADLPKILQFTTDAQVATHSSWGPLSLAETEEYLRKSLSFIEAKPRLNYALAIVEKSRDDLIGNVSLNIRSLLNREAEIGYTLRRDQWNQGYAAEAARAVLGFAFHELKLHRIFATTSPLNHPSQKVLNKLGFRQEGYLRKSVLQRNQWRDSLLFAMLEEDFV